MRDLDRIRTEIYPPIEPFATGRLQVDPLHSVYWEQCGNPYGTPVLYLHGGPGGGITPRARQFFDPVHYRIVLFDQRGAGKSRPLGECRRNNTQVLIDDIERLREKLGIERWVVFGGSWGSTLALAYGQVYPRRCLSFVLRGIFLGRKFEIEWFLNGMRTIHPEAWSDFVAHVPEDHLGNLAHWFNVALHHRDPDIHMPLARAWSRYEAACSTLVPNPAHLAQFEADQVALAIARLEAHYFVHDCFISEGSLLDNIGRIRHLPCVIVQGRHDVVCPPISAWDLHRAWPSAEYVIVPDGGHSAWEPGVRAELVKACERMKFVETSL